MNDIHVSKDNIPDFHKNWDEALSVCRDRSIPRIIVGGDLWQSRSSQTLGTLMAVRQAIIKATRTVEVVLSEGNHDKVDQEATLGYCHIFSEYPHVRVVDDYLALDCGNDTTLFVMSYFPENGSFIGRLRDMERAIIPTKRNILYIHEGINGALSTASDKELPANIFGAFDTVLVGHYHNRCRIKGTNIEYIGSSRQHNFGEDEKKGYTVLYEDGTHEFVQNQANIRYKMLELSPDEIDERLIKELNAARDRGDCKLKVRINCGLGDAPAISKDKLLEAGASKVEIMTGETVLKEVAAQSLEKKFDLGGIKREYATFCTDKEIQDVKLGLSYLDKISQPCGN